MGYLQRDQLKEEDKVFLENQLFEMNAYFRKCNIDFFVIMYPNQNEVLSEDQITEFGKKRELPSSREDLMSFYSEYLSLKFLRKIE